MAAHGTSAAHRDSSAGAHGHVPGHAPPGPAAHGPAHATAHGAANGAAHGARKQVEASEVMPSKTHAHNLHALTRASSGSVVSSQQPPLQLPRAHGSLAPVAHDTEPSPKGHPPKSRDAFGSGSSSASASVPPKSGSSAVRKTEEDPGALHNSPGGRRGSADLRRSIGGLSLHGAVTAMAAKSSSKRKDSLGSNARRWQSVSKDAALSAVASVRGMRRNSSESLQLPALSESSTWRDNPDSPEGPESSDEDLEGVHIGRPFEHGPPGAGNLARVSVQPAPLPGLGRVSLQSLGGLPRMSMDSRGSLSAGTAPPAGAPSQAALTHIGLKLQALPMFEGFGLQVLQAIEKQAEMRVFAKGEVLYREGEKQTWMGILDAGSARVSIGVDNVADNGAIKHLQVGGAFGELAVLRVKEGRPSTLTADSESIVIVVDGGDLWNTLRNFSHEKDLFQTQVDRWKAFLGSKLIAACRTEVAYQLRCSATQRSLVSLEGFVVGSKGPSQTSGGDVDETTAVVELGALRIDGDDDHGTEDFGVSATVNDCGVLGIRRVLKVVSSGGPCGITLLTRQAFWRIISTFPQEREHFTKLALERLPPSTFDLSSCDLVQYLQGTASFMRAVNSLTRQRVCHPGTDICEAGQSSDILRVLQQGAAEVVVQGHRVRVVHVGDSYGEPSFLGLLGKAPATLRALDLCVVQEISRRDIEPHFVRHPAVRSRIRELAKLKSRFKLETGMDVQVKQLRDMTFFSEMSVDFLMDILPDLEDRIYLPKQTLSSEQMYGHFMTIVIEGQCTKHVAGERDETLGPGSTSGEVGLLCNYDQDGVPSETLVADTVCYVQHLHRALLIKSLKRVPSEKRHFENIAKSYMGVTTVSPATKDGFDGDANTNIYSLPFFRNCGSRFVYLLDIHLERHIFFCDEEIVQENTEGEDMYILYSGVAKVQVKGVRVAQLCGGMCFGEMAVLGLVKKRTATIIATTICDIRILSRKSMEEAIKEFPEERERFESLSATRHRLSMEKQFGGKITQTSRFFKNCDAKFAAAITDCMQDKLYMEGQIIMREGDSGDWMVLIHQGRCEVLVEGEQVASLGGGDVVGEMAVLGIASVRTATVRALEVCFAQVLHRAQLLPVLQCFPNERASLRLQAARRMQDRAVQGSDTIRSCPMWENAQGPFTDYIDRRLQRWIFCNGDIILTEGSKGKRLVMVMRGVAEVMQKDEIISELGHGEIIGELAVMGISEKRTATVRCKEICDTYTLKRQDLEEAMRRWPEHEAQLRRLAATRLRKDVERGGLSGSFLVNCPLFEQCSAKFIQCISVHLEDSIYMPMEVLCTQGEAGDTMFVLMRGTLSCLVGDNEALEMHAGSVIGEIAVLGLSSVRTATLRAKTVCLVQILCRSSFMKYVAEFPREMIHFQEVGSARMAKSATSESAEFAVKVFQEQFLFKEASPPFLARLALRLQRKFFFASQKIVKEGTESNEMFAITEGRATVEKRNVVVRELDKGFCFGEMAVLGIATAQTLTVRAELLCDVQVLSRWDLEELLVDFPEERARLLGIVAENMRDDLAGVTNTEILQELPLFQGMDEDLMEELASEATVHLCRKEELVVGVEQELLSILLQGSANLEVSGVAIRELAVGDHFGSCRLLGAGDLNNVQVRATASCLTLRVSKDSFEECVNDYPKAKKHYQDQTSKLTRTSSDMRQAVLLSAPVLQYLKLPAERLTELLRYCEERVCLPKEEILDSHMRASTLLLVLSGQASIGQLGMVLEQSCSLGDFSEQVSAADVPVYAVSLCMVLVLHRKAFLAWTRELPAEEGTRITSRLDLMPRQDAKAALVGATLRLRADKMATECIIAAKWSIRAQRKLVGYTAPKPQKRKGWGLAKGAMHAVKRINVLKDFLGKTTVKFGEGFDRTNALFAEGDHEREHKVALNSRSHLPRPALKPPSLLSNVGGSVDASEKTVPNREASPPSPSSSRGDVHGRKGAASSLKARTASPRIAPVLSTKAIMEREERRHVQELERLMAAARCTAAAAREEEAKLRVEANSLRERYAALQSMRNLLAAAAAGESKSKLAGGAAGADDLAAAEAERRNCEAAERRVAALKQQLKRAMAEREGLLKRLGG